jgi:hypothetical protein
MRAGHEELMAVMKAGHKELMAIIETNQRWPSQMSIMKG